MGLSINNPYAIVWLVLNLMVNSEHHFYP